MSSAANSESHQVIYEVNISVDLDSSDAYIAWLQGRLCSPLASRMQKQPSSSLPSGTAHFGKNTIHTGPDHIVELLKVPGFENAQIFQRQIFDGLVSVSPADS